MRWPEKRHRFRSECERQHTRLAIHSSRGSECGKDGGTTSNHPTGPPYPRSLCSSISSFACCSVTDASMSLCCSISTCGRRGDRSSATKGSEMRHPSTYDISSTAERGRLLCPPQGGGEDLQEPLLEHGVGGDRFHQVLRGQAPGGRRPASGSGAEASARPTRMLRTTAEQRRANALRAP